MHNIILNNNERHTLHHLCTCLLFSDRTIYSITSFKMKNTTTEISFNNALESH